MFDKDFIKGGVPKVPQQNNYSDCGVYVLQYVESFFKVIIFMFNLFFFFFSFLFFFFFFFFLCVCLSTFFSFVIVQEKWKSEDE